MLLIELNVKIRAVYNPAPGDNAEGFGPNTFTAGSNLELQCIVMGNSGDLQYNWSVNPNFVPSCPTKGCKINVTSNPPFKLTVGKPQLQSYYSGNYSCTAHETDRPESQNNHNFTVKVVGELVNINIFLHCSVTIPIYLYTQELGYMLLYLIKQFLLAP